MNNKYSERLLQAINTGRLGLTRADFMPDDALTQHIRKVKTEHIRKVGFVNKLKRTIEEIKTSDDEKDERGMTKSKKQRFKEIFKTEPDFEIEKSDSESVVTQKNDDGDDDIKSVASEAVITDDEIGEITDDEIGDILDGDDKDYRELITGLNQARDYLIMEDLSDLEKKPRILNRDLTNPREIKVTRSIIQDAIKGVEAKEKQLVDLSLIHI